MCIVTCRATPVLCYFWQRWHLLFWTVSILYLQKPSNDLHPSICICMMPKRLPVIFPAPMLHQLGQKDFPVSSSLFDFQDQLIHINQKDNFTRTKSHNLKMQGPLPFWGPNRTWGRMDVHGHRPWLRIWARSLSSGSEHRQNKCGTACTPSCKLAFTHILSLFSFYVCLLAFLLWPQGTLATFPGTCSDGRGELPPLPLGPHDITPLIPTMGRRTWKLIQEANK